MRLACHGAAWGVAGLLLLAVAGCRDGGGQGSDPGTTSGTDGGGTDTGASADGTDDGTDTGEPIGMCPEVTVGATPLRRLTRAQYANAVRDLLGVTADTDILGGDEKVGPFDSNLSAPVSPVQIDQYRSLSEDVAADAIADLAGILPCQAGAPGCTGQFVASFGRRAFRRPLTQDEIDAHVALAEGADTFEDGIRIVLQAMLQSPYFLYRFELDLPDPDATGVVALSDFELASRLSFFLWNSVPDDALLDAAEAGELADAQMLRTQAERLLDDARARESVASFHVQWLGLDELPYLTKDPNVYGTFDETLRDAMVAETRRFSSLVVLEGDGKLRTLLTAPYSYLDGPLYGLYGVTEPPDASVGTPVPLPTDERAGLLTQGSFLAVHAHTNQSGPIDRGATVRTAVLCDPPPPPPPGIDVIPPDPDPNATTREIFEQHTADPTCAGCHELIDGIGLGMEGYDGIGAFREIQNGLPVDQSGELVGTDVDGPFEGAVELAHQLAESEQVRECVSRQWFRYAFGRYESIDDDCSLELLSTQFAASDGDVRDLLLTLVTTDPFRYRLAQ